MHHLRALLLAGPRSRPCFGVCVTSGEENKKEPARGFVLCAGLSRTALGNARARWHTAGSLLRIAVGLIRDSGEHERLNMEQGWGRMGRQPVRVHVPIWIPAALITAELQR